MVCTHRRRCLLIVFESADITNQLLSAMPLNWPLLCSTSTGYRVPKEIPLSCPLQGGKKKIAAADLPCRRCSGAGDRHGAGAARSTSGGAQSKLRTTMAVAARFSALNSATEQQALREAVEVLNRGSRLAARCGFNLRRRR
jgi:hypothetical protein